MDSLVADREFSLVVVTITKGLLKKSWGSKCTAFKVQWRAYILLFLWCHLILALAAGLFVTSILPIMSRELFKIENVLLTKVATLSDLNLLHSHNPAKTRCPDSVAALELLHNRRPWFFSYADGVRTAPRSW